MAEHRELMGFTVSLGMVGVRFTVYHCVEVDTSGNEVGKFVAEHPTFGRCTIARYGKGERYNTYSAARYAAANA